MSLMARDTVRVQIYGKEYEVDAGGLTPLEASRLASYVDEKMKEISEKLHIVDTQKVAVLACLNIAYDLFAAKENGQNTVSHISEKVSDMVSDLEEALADDNK